MKTSSLYDQWRAMDDRRLSSKPVSVRLPVHVMARLNAIADLFPTKTRTDILTDLLKVGLASFEDSLPPLAYSSDTEEIEPGLVVVSPRGETAEYRKSANRHYAQLENELGNMHPQTLLDVPFKKVNP